MLEENEPEAQRVLLEIETYGRPALLEADRCRCRPGRGRLLRRPRTPRRRGGEILVGNADQGEAAMVEFRAARLAVLAFFFLNGFGFASWVVRVPAIQ